MTAFFPHKEDVGRLAIYWTEVDIFVPYEHEQEQKEISECEEIAYRRNQDYMMASSNENNKCIKNKEINLGGNYQDYLDFSSLEVKFIPCFEE